MPEIVLVTGSIEITLTVPLPLAADVFQLEAENGPLGMLGILGVRDGGVYLDKVMVEPDVLLQL